MRRPIQGLVESALSYWQVDDRQPDLTTLGERVDQIRFAIEMCQTVGPDGIAYSAFAGTALFGLFLWWIGHSTGVLLDGRD